MPEPLAEELAELRRLTGFQSLNRLWAKLEILFGLFAVGVGFVTGVQLAQRPEVEIPWWAWAGPVLLIMLGGYLALAGHRSHLYQSNIRLTAFLAYRLKRPSNGEPAA